MTGSQGGENFPNVESKLWLWHGRCYRSTRFPTPWWISHCELLSKCLLLSCCRALFLHLFLFICYGRSSNSSSSITYFEDSQLELREHTRTWHWRMPNKTRLSAQPSTALWSLISLHRNTYRKRSVLLISLYPFYFCSVLFYILPWQARDKPSCDVFWWAELLCNYTTKTKVTITSMSSYYNELSLSEVPNIRRRSEAFAEVVNLTTAHSSFLVILKSLHLNQAIPVEALVLEHGQWIVILERWFLHHLIVLFWVVFLRRTLLIQDPHLLEKLVQINLRLLFTVPDRCLLFLLWTVFVSDDLLGLGVLRGTSPLLKLLEPLVNDMDAGLRIEVEQTARGKHRHEVPRREPLELVAGLVREARARLEVGQVKVRLGAIQPPRGLVIGHGSLLSSGERPQPEPSPLLGLPDLSNPFAPSPLPDASVGAGGVLRAALAPCRALLPRLERGLPEIVHCFQKGMPAWVDDEAPEEGMKRMESELRVGNQLKKARGISRECEGGSVKSFGRFNCGHVLGGKHFHMPVWPLVATILSVFDSYNFTPKNILFIKNIYIYFRFSVAEEARVSTKCTRKKEAKGL